MLKFVRVVALVFLLAICQIALSDDEIRIAIPTFRIPTSMVEQLGQRYGSSISTAVMRELMVDMLSKEIRNKAPGVILVERREMDAALSELKLDENALFEQSDTSRLGKFVKADYVIIGSVMTLGVGEIPMERQRYLEMGKHPYEAIATISARMVDISRNTVVDSATVTSREHLGPLQAGVVKDLGSSVVKAASYACSDIMDTLSPYFSPIVKAKAIGDSSDVFVFRGEKHGAQVGDKYKVYGIKDLIKDGDVTMEDREDLGTITVTEVQEGVSRATFDAPPKKKPQDFKQYGIRAIRIKAQ